jgi:hypothetical protein
MVVASLVSGCLFVSLGKGAEAQTLVAKDTAVSILNAQTSTGRIVQQEYISASSIKLSNLIAFASRELGGAQTPNLNDGFTTQSMIRYNRGGVYSDMEARVTVVPLYGSHPRYPTGSAAIVVLSYPATRQLTFPRLLIRRTGADWNATEYAYRVNNVVTEMSARFSDCPALRSSLKVLEKLLPEAHRSLRNTLTQTATSRNHVGVGLKAIYDVRMFPVGQRSMLLATGLMTPINFEEEFSLGYIDGVYADAFRIERNDPAWLKAAKSLAKQVFTDLIKILGKSLVKIILSWF